MALTERVKYLAKCRGLTMVKLSEQLGMDHSQFYKMLKGNPGIETIERIANVLNVEPYEILGDSDFFGVFHYKNETYKIETYKKFLELSNKIEEDLHNISKQFYANIIYNGKSYKIDNYKNLEELKKIIDLIDDSENNLDSEK